MKKSAQYIAFSKAMDSVLKADPDAVRAAMEAEKRERELEQQRTGKRGRGRPPKQSSASSRASS
jgi:hypothetical protein